LQRKNVKAKFYERQFTPSLARLETSCQLQQSHPHQRTTEETLWKLVMSCLFMG
jgi:hypothetical protein